jgi:hypothetical protein
MIKSKFICLLLFIANMAIADSEVFGIKRKPIVLDKGELVYETVIFPSLVSFKNENYFLSLTQVGVDIAGIILIINGFVDHDPLAPLLVPAGLGLIGINRVVSLPENLLGNQIAPYDYSPFPLLTGFNKNRAKVGISLFQLWETSMGGIFLRYKNHYLLAALPLQQEPINILCANLPSNKRFKPDADPEVFFKDTRSLYLAYKYAAIKTKYTEYVLGIRSKYSKREYFSYPTRNYGDSDTLQLYKFDETSFHFEIGPLAGIYFFILNKFSLGFTFEYNFPVTDMLRGYNGEIRGANYSTLTWGMNIGIW